MNVGAELLAHVLDEENGYGHGAGFFFLDKTHYGYIKKGRSGPAVHTHPLRGHDGCPCQAPSARWHVIMPNSVEIRKELSAARACTDRIVSLFKPETLYERPIPERHRVIFYVGHLEAFDWNQICRWTLGQSSFHPTFDALFEAGIDPEVGSGRDDTPEEWPSIEAVQRYNAKAREAVDRALDEAPETILRMAIEHRWMHAETTAYLLHHASHSGKMSPSIPPCPEYPTPRHTLIDIPDGMVTLGREDGFGWDNEFGAHHVDVPAFAISQYKVTNEQYLCFVNEGGPVPPFWIRRGDRWYVRTMFEDIVLPPHWPVYVSLKDAMAYAQWAGCSLPTEAQFHRAAYGVPAGEERAYPWGNQGPNGVHGNFHFRSWDPVPVTANPQSDSAFGVSQLVGNGWEWTSTPFHPFEGFQSYPTYPGYSARFFDDDHFIVKGAAPATATCLLRRSFRNWFRQGYPHAHAGFRCVRPV
ncbi:MAG: SUMF1/EgtB/PvdO family nonheme iron enzyme [Nitrospira sp.]|nr:SUMF1/EgtB/PvdO family nonheme iron enzyme [Nitrospira sp.]